MKSSTEVTQEFQGALGKPIRPQPQKPQPVIEQRIRGGTVVVGRDGFLRTDIIGNEAANPPQEDDGCICYRPLPEDLPSYFAAINGALALRLGDTVFPIDEYGI